MTKTVSIITGDSSNVSVKVETARKFDVIRNLFDDLGEDKVLSEPVPLPLVHNKDVLAFGVELLEQSQAPMEIANHKCGPPFLLEVLKLADYMMCQELIDIMVKVIARLLERGDGLAYCQVPNLPFHLVELIVKDTRLDALVRFHDLLQRIGLGDGQLCQLIGCLCWPCSVISDYDGYNEVKWNRLKYAKYIFFEGFKDIDMVLSKKASFLPPLADCKIMVREDLNYQKDRKLFERVFPRLKEFKQVNFDLDFHFSLPEDLKRLKKAMNIGSFILYPYCDYETPADFDALNCLLNRTEGVERLVVDFSGAEPGYNLDNLDIRKISKSLKTLELVGFEEDDYDFDDDFDDDDDDDDEFDTMKWILKASSKGATLT